jgi:hypothetical protein
MVVEVATLGDDDTRQVHGRRRVACQPTVLHGKPQDLTEHLMHFANCCR